MRDNKGFTLIEILVALTILGLIMGSIGQLMSSGVQSWQRGETSLEAEQNLRIALERIKNDLQGSSGVAIHSSATQLVLVYPDNVEIKYSLGSLEVTGPGNLKGRTLMRTYTKYTNAYRLWTVAGYPKTKEIANYIQGLDFSYNDFATTGEMIDVTTLTDATYVKVGITSGTLSNGSNLGVKTGIALRGKFLPRG